ncbi:unnamed protein product [Amaranthus hypochondriacus]
MGDFNCIANFNERIGHRVMNSEIQPLRGCMMNCGLHDIKFNGRFYSWTNKQAGSQRVLSKIDRALGNNLWDDKFPNAQSIFLPEGQFDHSPILVQFFNTPTGMKPFKFCNFWSQKPDFLVVVRKRWDMQVTCCLSFQITQKLKILKHDLKQAYHTEPLQIKLLKLEAEVRIAQV